MKVKNKVLTIDKNCIFKTKVDNLSNFKDSIFEEAYLKAAKSLREIIKYHERNSELNKYNVQPTYNNNFHGGYIEEQNLNDYDYNNIIAFVGDRGSGKTSTMKSFRNSLNLKINYEDFQLEEYKGLEKYKFELLKTIDPTLFSNKESIVEIIVAQMFEKFKEYSGESSLSRKKDLATKFEKVYKDIKIINSSKNSCLENTYDNLEALMDLSSAISLKEDMKELVSYYMDYMNWNNKNENFLVISIDDLDMNLTVGQKMIEDIRKYLIIPNVIILMAIKIEQLEEVVSRKFIMDLSENEKLYKDLGQIEEFKENIDIKTERYLEKIIPLDRRIYMPQISLKNVDIKINTMDFPNIKFNNNSENEEWSTSNLRSIVSINLFRKANYIITTEEHYKAIVTENLRSFIEFIVLLNNMRDEEDKINNINILIDYFEKVIVNEIRDTQNRNFLKSVINCDTNDINRKSIIFLNKKIKSEDIRIKERRERYVNINDWIEKNQMFINWNRIDLGDIITWIMMYYKTFNKYDEIKFIEIFKGILSLKLLNENFRNQEILYKNTGLDFIGEYFKITKNSSAKCITETLNNYNIKELIDKLRENSNEYLKENEIPFFLNPNFKETKLLDNHYSILCGKLLRREMKEYIEFDEIVQFKNYIYKPLNIIGFSVYSKTLKNYQQKYRKLYQKADEIYAIEKYVNNELLNSKYEYKLENDKDLNIIYIINIDFWMTVLKYLDISIQTSYEGSLKKRFNFKINIIKKINQIVNILCEVYDLNENFFTSLVDLDLIEMIKRVNEIIEENFIKENDKFKIEVDKELRKILKDIVNDFRIRNNKIVKINKDFKAEDYKYCSKMDSTFIFTMNVYKERFNKCKDNNDIEEAKRVLNEWKSNIGNVKNNIDNIDIDLLN